MDCGKIDVPPSFLLWSIQDSNGNLYKRPIHKLCIIATKNELENGLVGSGVASSISGRDIFIYSSCAQIISFEMESISKKINCAERE